MDLAVAPEGEPADTILRLATLRTITPERLTLDIKEEVKLIHPHAKEPCEEEVPQLMYKDQETQCQEQLPDPHQSTHECYRIYTHLVCRNYS